ncbi:hypothetical protein PIB30_015691 [Stylosanthes scabra]|uniref:Uncharacterized protein n=1 Tax=Stylosanthes scabra TaxID=79078 RepID=A0ABU6V636_9FABA|nr:hypothetical protein [Stylosanthes scabra]
MADSKCGLGEVAVALEWIVRGCAILTDRFVEWERRNDSVRGRRDLTGLFAAEFVCVCTVFDVVNKVARTVRD